MIRNRHHAKYGLKPLLCGILFLGLLFPPSLAKAASDKEYENVNVLIVYSSRDRKVDEHQRLLDLLISHFTTNVTFKSSNEVQEKDLEGITHLFYYGQVEDKLPNSFLRMFSTFTGTVVAIGYNANQLETQFSFMKPVGVKEYTEIFFSENEKRKRTVEPQKVMEITIEDNTDVLIEVSQGDKEYPLFVHHQNAYYYAMNDLFPPNSNFLAEALHNVFKISHETSTRAYLRLEDIHPLVDPEYVSEIAKILKQRDIPYMVSVIPVYVNPETEEKYHLSDAPELVKELKYMQDNGGSIILHGYTDQYFLGETGDGYEFWDIEKNSPIYQSPEVNTPIKTEEDFSSGTAYKNYIKNLEEYETAYIEERLNKGIQDLVYHGLNPVAFEAPHYAMSQNGYEVVSEYFSTIVGQVQLTDDDWKIMTEAPNITSPSFLHGMKLLPETIRYVRYDDPTSIQEMKDRVNDFSIVRDGIIGGFYHPFLGVDGLVDLIDEMEKIPNLEWIDIKDVNNTVKTGGVVINNGKLVSDKTDRDEGSSGSTEFPTYLIKLSKDNVLWVLAGSGTTMFMAFLSYVFFRRIRNG
ncbi:DUF2334 domain-containing protein [Virgibacillus ndiopensis]|uniref:DUF2334 domain-containing protein n=1 Tax=Virgibacillus ndiopensis TaxID=2004408 RepID=UPI000C06BC07|nr:polysaccharide deacetylase family protein [Virgibacillus ndiopensis]